jgi:CheY-like chemotaxis protein
MQRKLLFAEDDKAFHEIVKRAFKGTGWDVSSAYDGVDALASIAGQMPDVILLDLNMPRLGGRELLASLRSNPRTAMVPIIIVSGDDSPSEQAAEFGIGADDFVSKPFDTTELVARIEAAARRARRMLAANPLTMLPGGPAIEDEAGARIASGDPLAFFYIDIDNFKAYNDNYGYLKGDEAIRSVAQLLTEVQNRFAGRDIFVGHIGGDDFVMMCDPAMADEVAGLVAYGFDASAPGLYLPEDAARGYIAAEDRSGKARLFPLMGLTIAVATNEKRALDHYAKMVDIVSEIKKFLKGRPGRKGSAWLKDRRQD